MDAREVMLWVSNSTAADPW